MKPRRGVYILLLTARGDAQVGALGRAYFDGLYGYVGSARGPGGIRRLHRHLEVAGRKRSRRHWHIDYLLGIGQIRGAFFIATERPLECRLAQALGERASVALPRFGSSDCRCPGHLFLLPNEETARKAMATLGEGLEVDYLPGTPQGQE